MSNPILKHAFFLGIFILILSGINIYFSMNVEPSVDKVSPNSASETELVSDFGGLNYHRIDNDNHSLAVKAERLLIKNEKYFTFTSPDGVMHDTKLNEDYFFKSKSAKYNQLVRLLDLDGSVVISSAGRRFSANQIRYDAPAGDMRGSGAVNVFWRAAKSQTRFNIAADFFSADLNQEIIKFNGSVKGKARRKLAYESGFRFESDRMAIFQKDQYLTMNDNLRFWRNNFKVRARRAEVFLENFNKKLKYYVFYDDIKLTQKLENTLGSKGRAIERYAYGERLDGIASQNKLVLSGAPRVEQGSDTIKGYQITLRENAELVEVDDSRSSLRIKPQESNERE